MMGLVPFQEDTERVYPSSLCENIARSVHLQTKRILMRNLIIQNLDLVLISL